MSDLQAAFDAGFDSVKAYVDDITDQVEERLVATETILSGTIKQLKKIEKKFAREYGAKGS
jgi:hypothetical protein